MLLLHVLLFFTLGTFTAAAPVVSAPVSLHPRACKFLHCVKQIWFSFTSSPKNSSPQNGGTDNAHFKQRAAGYWYSEDFQSRHLIYIHPGGNVVLLTVALDLSAVFEGRVWKRVPDIGTYKRLLGPNEEPEYDQISGENQHEVLITNYVPAKPPGLEELLTTTFKTKVNGKWVKVPTTLRRLLPSRRHSI